MAHINRATRSPFDALDKGPGHYLDIEIPWVQRCAFLESRGYRLRPRYQPGFTPFWNETDQTLWIEEAITPLRHHLMDAIRTADGAQVLIKRVPRSSPEADLGLYTTSDRLRADPRNHCIPLLEVLDDPLDAESMLLVFPLVRPITEPTVASISESVDFIEQTLEGLVFLHEHEIAHRDCAAGNLMMDSRALFPGGWHAMARYRHPDGRFLRKLQNPSISAAGGVRYYFIDFGISTRGQSLTLGLPGQERAPELSDRVPYNPFKLDVYILGRTYQQLLLDVYSNVQFITPLVEAMTAQDPSRRPTAVEAQAWFREAKGTFPTSALTNRLRPINPGSPFQEKFKDVKYGIRDSFYRLKPKRALPPFAVSTPRSFA